MGKSQVQFPNRVEDDPVETPRHGHPHRCRENEFLSASLKGSTRARFTDSVQNRLQKTKSGDVACRLRARCILLSFQNRTWSRSSSCSICGSSSSSSRQGVGKQDARGSAVQRLAAAQPQKWDRSQGKSRGTDALQFCAQRSSRTLCELVEQTGSDGHADVCFEHYARCPWCWKNRQKLPE